MAFVLPLSDAACRRDLPTAPPHRWRCRAAKTANMIGWLPSICDHARMTQVLYYKSVAAVACVVSKADNVVHGAKTAKDRQFIWRASLRSMLPIVRIFLPITVTKTAQGVLRSCWPASAATRLHRTFIPCAFRVSTPLQRGGGPGRPALRLRRSKDADAPQVAGHPSRLSRDYPPGCRLRTWPFPSSTVRLPSAARRGTKRLPDRRSAHENTGRRLKSWEGILLQPGRSATRLRPWWRLRRGQHDFPLGIHAVSVCWCPSPA
jgi:hypothetical protein